MSAADPFALGGRQDDDPVLRLAAELVRRGADVEGMMFRSTIVAETSVTTLDRAAIERDMGETWIAKYLKWSRHCASVRTAPLAAVVAKMAA